MSNEELRNDEQTQINSRDEQVKNDKESYIVLEGNTCIAGFASISPLSFFLLQSTTRSHDNRAFATTCLYLGNYHRCLQSDIPRHMVQEYHPLTVSPLVWSITLGDQETCAWIELGEAEIRRKLSALTASFAALVRSLPHITNLGVLDEFKTFLQ